MTPVTACQGHSGVCPIMMSHMLLLQHGDVIQCTLLAGKFNLQLNINEWIVYVQFNRLFDGPWRDLSAYMVWGRPRPLKGYAIRFPVFILNTHSPEMKMPFVYVTLATHVTLAMAGHSPVFTWTRHNWDGTSQSNARQPHRTSVRETPLISNRTVV